MKAPSINEILFQLKDFNDNDLSQFSFIATSSFEKVTPVFTKPRYVDFFWHCASTVPGWIDQVVLANAEAESQGSKKLLDLWKSTVVNKAIEDAILFHAKDESRHSHLFVKLTSVAFGRNEEELRGIRNGLTRITSADLKKDESTVSDDVLIDNLIQMNMGEIRTLIHMHFLGPIIFAMTPKANKDKVFNILQGLAKDEIVHIGYTSKLIEDWCSDGNYQLAKEIYNRRLLDFHLLTIQQTETAVKQYGDNRFPDLLEI